MRWRLGDDYNGRVYVGSGSNDRAAVWVSRVGKLVQEWAAFKAEHNVESFREWTVRGVSQAIETDAADRVPDVDYDDVATIACEIAELAGKSESEILEVLLRKADRKWHENWSGLQLVIIAEGELAGYEAEFPGSADRQTLREAVRLEGLHRLEHPDHYVGCGECHNCRDGGQCNRELHAEDVECDYLPPGAVVEVHWPSLYVTVGEVTSLL
jgi:hypothetical protein